jgi:glyoxylase-like metal-dependent hydrolase (beta-lactamase superfamily II)
VVRKFSIVAACVALFCGSAIAQDAKTVIANAKTAMGAGLNSVTYSGTAKDVAFQQCGPNITSVICQGMHDPMRPITNYVRVIDLSGPASRATGATMNAPGGGATGPPAAGNFSQQITAQQVNIAQPWPQQVEFWLTPWGFLKGAEANNAMASRRRLSGKSYTVLAWSPTVKAASGASFVVNGWVNEENNLIERVETWLPDNLMGDMHVLATYTGWKDFGGVKAPAKIVQTRGGWPFFEVEVAAAKMNPPDLATLAVPPAGAGGRGGGGAPPAGAPPAGAPGGGGRGAGAPPAGAPQAAAGGGRGAGAAVPPPPGGAPPAAGGQGRGGQAPAPAAPAQPEKLGEGLWRTTNAYNSLIIDFKDYIMILEAGTNEAQTLAVIADAKRLIPNKPIRYVMNTHPHSDHTAGIPTMVAEGAAIITHNNNKEFFERALSTPRTLLTDTLAKNPKPVKVEGVGSKKSYSDGNRVVEFHHIPGAPHSNGLLVAYIPKEKVLFQGDFSLPAAGAQANDHIKHLVPVLEKLNLDFDRYINVHNSATPQTKADLWKAVGK